VRRRALALLAAPTLAGLLVAGPVGAVFDSRHWQLAAVAFGLCVPPGLATFALVEYLARTSPYGRLLGLMIGTAVRLLIGFGGGAAWVLLAGPDDPPGKVAFLLWLLFAYLATLVAETVVLARPVGSTRAGPAGV
jgi:hypothetical protein